MTCIHRGRTSISMSCRERWIPGQCSRAASGLLAVAMILADSNSRRNQTMTSLLAAQPRQ